VKDEGLWSRHRTGKNHAAAKLTSLALQGKRFNITLQETDDGADWSPESLGYYIQSVLQGAFVFAKARQGPEVVRESLSHLRHYLVLLFPRTTPRKRTRKETP